MTNNCICGTTTLAIVLHFVFENSVTHISDTDVGFKVSRSTLRLFSAPTLHNTDLFNEGQDYFSELQHEF